MLSFFFVEKEKLSARKTDVNDFDQVFYTAEEFSVNFLHNIQRNYAFKREFSYL